MPYAKSGKEVKLKQALGEWQPHAIDYLKKTASTYNAFTTYKELGDYVTGTTGITYDWNYQWVGKLLGPIVWKCKRKEWPPLTSLVVRQDDHSVGLGYDENFRAEGIEVQLSENLVERQIQLDEHAALGRLRCYQRFCTDLPTNAKPTFTPLVRASRAKMGLPTEW
jgi:hypothetical protein